MAARPWSVILRTVLDAGVQECKFKLGKGVEKSWDGPNGEIAFGRKLNDHNPLRSAK